MKGSENIWLTVGFFMISVWTAGTVYVQYHPNNLPEIQEEDRVCTGMTGGLNQYGDFSEHYNIQRNTFTNCTYVDGNLIITWHEDPNINYDMNFLRDIRYVRGYVLISMSDVWSDLPLLNLEMIRGNQTFTFRGQDSALAVLFTNFTRIRMPKLKEVSKGNVIEILNRPEFRIEVTRDWDTIMRGRASNEPGSLGIEHQDQMASPDMCSPLCPRRCFMPGPDGCCDSQCAGGCRGPRSTDCELCKDFKAHGDCVSHCPTLDLLNYYPEGRECVPY